MSNPILEAAITYADRGWRVVPLRPKGKVPWLTEWQINATAASDVVIEWWNGRPESNVGIQLGPRSKLIDIEGDEADSEKEILVIFGGQIPHCPTFKSARSIHRIFQWHDRLPGGAVIHIGAVEIRIGNDSKGAQSVFPPSIHESGAQYAWLEGLTPDDVEPPELSAVVLARIWNAAGEDTAVAPAEHGPPEWRKLFDQDNVLETKDRRENTLLSFACRQAARIPNIDNAQEQADLYTTMMAMNLTKCRPPLEEKEVQRIHRQAINYTRGDAGKVAKEDAGLTDMGLAHENGLWLPGSWELVTVLSDPPEYRLHVPQWEELTSDGRGVVPLSHEEIQDAGRVASKVLLITRTVVLADTPRKWPGIWHGQPGNVKDKRRQTRGLMARLIEASELEQAPGIEKRYMVVAELFQEIVVDRAKSPRGDDDSPHPTRPTKRADGTIWFRWAEAWREPMRDKLLTVAERTDLRRRLDITKENFQFFPKSAPGRKQYCVLKPLHIRRLLEIIDADSAGAQRAMPIEDP